MTLYTSSNIYNINKENKYPQIYLGIYLSLFARMVVWLCARFYDEKKGILLLHQNFMRIRRNFPFEGSNCPVNLVSSVCRSVCVCVNACVGACILQIKQMHSLFSIVAQQVSLTA